MLHVTKPGSPPHLCPKPSILTEGSQKTAWSAEKLLTSADLCCMEWGSQ